MTSHIAFTGTRTTARRGHGEGIYSFLVDQDGRWTQSHVTEAVNPGFLVLNEQHQLLYAASGDHDYLTTYRYDATGALEELQRVASGGTNPAHLALSPSGSWLVVANHSSGSLTSFPVGPDGLLGEEASRIDFEGTPGPHRTDQPGAKPHQVVFSPEVSWIAAPDNGLDAIHACQLDEATGALRVDQVLAAGEMAGPRHAVFGADGRALYVLGELNNTVSVYLDRKLTQVLPTLGQFDVRASRGGEILLSPDGRHVLASNRGGAGDHTPGGPEHDTIAVYEVQENGTLLALGFPSTGGIRPRFAAFGPHGELFTANENSDSVTSSVLAEDGLLNEQHQVAAVPSPVCIVFAQR